MTEPVGLAARLAELDDAGFDKVVFDNLPPGSPTGLWDALLGPELVHRTRRYLSDIARDLKETREDRRAALSAREYAVWARDEKVNETQRHLTARQAEAHKAAYEAHQLRLAFDRNHGRRLAARLARGIARHKAATAVAGLDPEPHDEALWSLLETETVPLGDDMVSAGEMLRRGIWRDEESP